MCAENPGGKSPTFIKPFQYWGSNRNQIGFNPGKILLLVNNCGIKLNCSLEQIKLNGTLTTHSGL